MQMYRRIRKPGGTYFFTLVTYGRSPIFTDALGIKLLRDSIVDCRKTLSFEINAFVLLPEHLHCIWTLPPGDADYSSRWKLIKRKFTHEWIKAGRSERRVSGSRKKHGHRGIWQRRFWEHTIEDDEDYWRHANYVHWNPVKHGLAKCPHQYAHSSFARWVADGRMAADWLCQCGRDEAPDPEFDGSDFGE